MKHLIYGLVIGVLATSVLVWASTYHTTIHYVFRNGLRAIPPATQTLAAGETVTADACGTLKPLTAASAVSTSLTNTFTAPTPAHDGCIMTVCNLGAETITLDNNALFLSAGAADVVVTANDCVVVGSDGLAWYQLAPLQVN